jgi:hypothetical protein
VLHNQVIGVHLFPIVSDKRHYHLTLPYTSQYIREAEGVFYHSFQADEWLAHRAPGLLKIQVAMRSHMLG